MLRNTVSCLPKAEVVASEDVLERLRGAGLDPWDQRAINRHLTREENRYPGNRWAAIHSLYERGLFKHIVRAAGCLLGFVAVLTLTILTAFTFSAWAVFALSGLLLVLHAIVRVFEYFDRMLEMRGNTGRESYERGFAVWRSCRLRDFAATHGCVPLSVAVIMQKAWLCYPDMYFEVQYLKREDEFLGLVLCGRIIFPECAMRVALCAWDRDLGVVQPPPHPNYRPVYC